MYFVHGWMLSFAALKCDFLQGALKLSKKVIDISSGDPQGAGMKPITFVRQVMAVCLCPELLREESLPLDVRLRALRFLKACDGESLGSYTASSGLPHVRKTIAEFITKRDGGVPAYAGNIFISSGAQRALMVIIKLLSGGEGHPQTGVLVPQPCPHTLLPLLDEAGVMAVPYRLTEDKHWAVDLSELHRALTTSRGRCELRAIYICNPGNPTGHLLDRKSIEEVIEFAAAERLLLLVDEVYQDSVYAPNREFISYKKVLFEMDKHLRDTVELVSFHSVSCACAAECGLRAGYMEVVNMDSGVMHFVDTMLCTDINAPVTGQLALDLMLSPPKPGDPSYDTFAQETHLTQATLAQNAQRALKLLNDLPGISCQPAMGGIYLYPHLDLPAEIQEQAKMLGLEADVLYCQMLLQQEGLIIGDGQHGGTNGSDHLRLCVLVPPDTLEEVLSRLSSFHLRLAGKEANRRVEDKDETKPAVTSGLIRPKLHLRGQRTGFKC
ncbi:alanine aminotransferase 1 isoform X1 [Fundulus heteroclitus]|uniref:alanine aminotransferase 1 isoform X1 n=1 Tax=Fundulus heteroclitus TaxID=8078 RepID=UPI00165CAEAB|nr:alanine aminotransferase 1 isoform X1 [Fundulus heteroclitus]